jgi:hypothetical protein
MIKSPPLFLIYGWPMAHGRQSKNKDEQGVTAGLSGRGPGKNGGGSSPIVIIGRIYAAAGERRHHFDNTRLDPDSQSLSKGS